MKITFNQNTSGEQVFARCKHKEHKTVLTYLIKVVKSLCLNKRPEMVLKKEEGFYVLKFCSLSKKDFDSMIQQLKSKVVKYNGEIIEFEVEGDYFKDNIDKVMKRYSKTLENLED